MTTNSKKKFNLLNFIKSIPALLKDFFNPKEWLTLLRSVPAAALTLMVLATVLMNLLANKSIINVYMVDVFGSGYAGDVNDLFAVQDAGLIMSWVGFLVGDLLVKCFGSKNAIRLNIAALGLSLFISMLLVGAAYLPGVWAAWYDVGKADPSLSGVINDSLNYTIGNTWYVILGSAAASFVGIMVNNISQGFFLDKIQKKHGDTYPGYLVAAGASTVIGQILDNMVFAALISTQFFGWTWVSVISCSVLGALVELIVEMVFTPLTYRISKNWDKNHIGVKWMSDAGRLAAAREVVAAADKR